MTAQELLVKLRKDTGASFNLCKDAADKYPEDYEKAKEYLLELLRNKMGTRTEKETKNGIIEVYTHGQAKSAACMVEILCETDFVAKNEELHKLAHELALQIVAANPVYVDKDSIPADDLAKLEAQWQVEVGEGKPANIVEKIVEGKLQKYLEEVSLMDQPYFKDDSIKIRDLFREVTTKLGENIKISRFVRWQI